MAGAFVKNIGSSSNSNSATAVVTVPAAGVALGNTVILRFGKTDSTAGTTVSSVVDTKGNTYAQIAAQSASGSRFEELWFAPVTVALVSGNTITVTFNQKSNSYVVGDEFSGLTTTKDGSGTTASGSSATPTATYGPSGVGLVVGALLILVGTADTFTEDADSDNGDTWHSLTEIARGTDAEGRGAYKITTSAANNTYDPALGTSRSWAEQIGAVDNSGGNSVALTGHGDTAATGKGAIKLTAAVTGHGDAASAGSGNVSLTEPIKGHGDAASAGRGNLSVTAALSGHGDAASTGRADLPLTAGLTGHGDTATTGRGAIALTAGLAGHGDSSNTGTASVALTAGLKGHGDAASSGSGALTVTPAGGTTQTYSGHGDAASAGAGTLSVTAGLSGHGDAATTGRADVLRTRGLSGSGSASSGGSGALQVTVGLSGHGDTSSAGSASVKAALGLSGHGDAASGGKAGLATPAGPVVVPADSYTLPRRIRTLHGTATSRWTYQYSATGQILEPEHGRAGWRDLFHAEYGRATSSATSHVVVWHCLRLRATHTTAMATRGDGHLWTVHERQLDDMEALFAILAER